MTYTGQITWQGDSGFPTGNMSITRVNDITTTTLLKDFAIALKNHSLCNFAWRHHIRTDPRVPLPPGVGANVDEKAIIYFRDPDTLEVLHFGYPAPIAADKETTPYGDRIKQSSVTTLVGYLSTAVGITYEPLYGVFVQRR